MKVVECPHFNTEAMLRLIWRRLMELSETDPIFGCYEWAYEWWRVFKQDKDQLRLMLIYDGGQPCGLAPLYLTQQYWGGVQANTLLPIGHTTAEYLELLLPIKPVDTASCLFDYLIGRPGWDVISLIHTPQNASTLKYIKSAALHRKLKVVEELEEVCPFIPLKDDFQTFMLKRFRAPYRKKIKRFNKRLKKMGAHKFEFISNHKHLINVLSLISELENKSWKGMKKLGIFSMSDSRRFFYQISKILADQNKLGILLQWIDNRLISYDYGFVSKHKFYSYNAAFDPAFSKHSPGALSMVELIRQCYDMGLTELDLLRGGEKYKAHWTDIARQNITLSIFAPTNKGNLIYRGLKGRLLLRRLKRCISPLQDVYAFELVNR